MDSHLLSLPKALRRSILLANRQCGFFCGKTLYIWTRNRGDFHVAEAFKAFYITSLFTAFQMDETALVLFRPLAISGDGASYRFLRSNLDLYDSSRFSFSCLSASSSTLFLIRRN